jgi:hypothetical protein
MIFTPHKTEFNRRRFCKTLAGLFVPTIVGLISKAKGQALTLNDPALGITKSGATVCSDGGVASDWAARVVTNGGTAIPAANVTAACNFVSTLKASGDWSNLLVVNLGDPTSLIGFETPLLRGSGGGGIDPWTNNSVVSGDISANGFTGDGGSKKFQTGFGTWASSQSVGFAVYIYNATGSGASFPYDMGVSDGGGTNYYTIAARFPSTNQTHAISGNNSNNAILTAFPGNGYFSDQRVSSTDHRLYWANGSNAHAQIGATDTFSWTSTLAGVPMYVGCGDFIFNGCSTDTMSAFIFSNGLSAAADARVFSALQTYLIARGGGFR